MKNTSTYFMVGIFVLVCLGVLIAGIIYISADKMTGDAIRVETYIDESVQGLSVGSAVMWRGVNIGRVERITFVPVEYPQVRTGEVFRKYGRYVLVIMAIRSMEFPVIAKDIEPESIHQSIDKQIALGLRFKVNYQGITGLAFMEADYVDPQRNPPLEVPWDPVNYYIPSSPSLIQNFTDALDKTFQRLENIDLEGVITKMDALLESLRQAVEDAQIGEVRKSIIAAGEDFNKTKEEVLNFLKEYESVPDDFTSITEQFSATMKKIDLAVTQHQPDVDKLLSDLEILIENLRHLSETLKANPSQLLFSKPPKTSEIVE